jgi:glycosyltransferase involved in cell wall biosynthesis
MRLAMYGPICATGGSSAQGLFDVVVSWLRSGHEIDFFTPGSFIDPAGLVAFSNFRFTRVPFPRETPAQRLVCSAFEAVEASPRPSSAARSAARVAATVATYQIALPIRMGSLTSSVRAAHQTRRYDAFVLMNGVCKLKVNDLLPVVSWAQGSPACESDFVRREPALVRGEVGWRGLAMLRGGYVIKDAVAAKDFDLSRGIIVASEWGKTMFVRAGAPEEKLVVVPFPVDVDRFRAQPRPAKPDNFVFLWLGRIVPRKRFPLALAAFERLRRRRPGARLLVAGGPGYTGSLGHLYKLPPLGPGVEHLGSLPSSEIPALLARADVIYQPSENETFGAAPAEGLASGIPSVVGPTHGTADVLLDTAFRFDRYEEEAIADAMERAMDAVLADPAGVSQRARAVAEKTAALPLVADRALRAVADYAERWHADRGAPKPRLQVTPAANSPITTSP